MAILALNRDGGHMRSLLVSMGLLALSFAVPANAKTRFEPYEARNAVIEGQGGSRTTKDGVDFWTLGDPPRRYQIIGVIRDNRGTGPLYGNAVGSSSIAKKVREVGGDAVILLNQNSKMTGVWSQGRASAYGNQAYGSALSFPIEERFTTFVVVKYLPDGQTQASEQPAAGNVPKP